jgi:hypothetical protein
MMIFAVLRDSIDWLLESILVAFNLVQKMAFKGLYLALYQILQPQSIQTDSYLEFQEEQPYLLPFRNLPIKEHLPLDSTKRGPLLATKNPPSKNTSIFTAKTNTKPRDKISARNRQLMQSPHNRAKYFGPNMEVLERLIKILFKDYRNLPSQDLFLKKVDLLRVLESALSWKSKKRSTLSVIFE